MPTIKLSNLQSLSGSSTSRFSGPFWDQDKIYIEMALVVLADDLSRAWDGSGTIVLTLLDLSAVFNTINHSILLEWPQGLRVENFVLRWFSSSMAGSSWCWWGRRDEPSSPTM